MIDGVASSPLGATDAGAIRELRIAPCRARTWCHREDGHVGTHAEMPRTEHAPEDFGPEAAKRRRY